MEKNSPNNNKRSHLTVVPELLLRPVEQPEPLASGWQTTDPLHHGTVTFRMDTNSLGLMRALAHYDSTSPAEQMRTAATLYLQARLGDQAVASFMTDWQRMLQSANSALAYAAPTQQNQIESEK